MCLPAFFPLPGTALPATISQLLSSLNAHLFPTFPTLEALGLSLYGINGQRTLARHPLSHAPILPLTHMSTRTTTQPS